MIQFEAEISAIIARTPEVKSFRFNIERDVDFKAGQFFFVTIDVEGEQQVKHFSFSNSPTEKGYLEFTKKITTSFFSQRLNRLKVGERANLKLPYGTFTFAGEYPKIAFLTGGIGITPVRSICRFVADTRLPTDIVLLYGNSRAEDIIFRQDFDQIGAAHKNIRVVYTLTAPDAESAGWSGRSGYITEEMVKTEIPDYRERVFYICGSPKMVAGLTDILRNKLAVSAAKIKLENFTGY